MFTRILKILTLGAVLVPMIAIGSGPGLVSFGVSMAQADVTSYRGMDARNSGKVKIVGSQFRIDDDGLSTFELGELGVGKACKLAFVIEGATSKPDAGTTGDITGWDGYEGTYTPGAENVNPGHWSIDKKVGDLTREALVTYATNTGAVSAVVGADGDAACDK